MVPPFSPPPKSGKLNNNIFQINLQFILILNLCLIFQTLSAISTEQSSTIVFPFPIDTLSLSMGVDKDKNKKQSKKEA